MKFYVRKALSTVVRSIHKVSDDMSRWHGALSLAVGSSCLLGKGLSTSKLIVVLSQYRPSLAVNLQLRSLLGRVQRLCVHTTVFCEVT